jgi:hypothetical protein
VAYTGYARVAAARARRYATPDPALPAKREDFRAYLATVWGFPLCITHIAGKDARGSCLRSEASVVGENDLTQAFRQNHV